MTYCHSCDKKISEKFIKKNITNQKAIYIFIIIS